MTTANLSVGIKTDRAKGALRDLRAEIQKAVSGAVLNVDTNQLKAALASLQSLPAVDVKLNASGMTNEVVRAVSKAFEKIHDVQFAGDSLTQRVRASVEAGMTGARAPLVGGVASFAGAGAALGVGDLKVAVIQTLMPSVEELGKAAAVLSASVKAVSGAARLPGPQSKVASVGISATDPLTGARVSVRERVEVEGAEAAIKELKEAQAALDLSTLKTKSAPRLDPRVLLNVPSRDSMKSFAAQLKAQMEEALDLSTLKTKSAPRLDPRVLLNVPSRDSMKSFAAQLKAQMEEEAEGLQASMQSAFAKVRDQASGRYTSRGADRVAASELSSRFGEQKARDFLGAKQFLLDETKGFDEFAKKQTGARAGLQNFHKALNDAHSAARGFAGSLGMLWTTWGSTVPLIAAAALGGALRSVYTVGKDLEYQLQFVSVLTAGGAVNVERFGQAVRGNMLVAPVEASQALRALAQNGLNLNDALKALPAVMNLAIAGEMGLSEAALGATGVMAAFNIQVEQLDHVGDVFAKAAALSNTSVGGMVEAMRQASTVSDQYKVSLEETAASLATLAKRNITGSAAGTAFRNMMTELAAPSKKAREALAQLNIELYDSNNQLKSYEEVLRIVREATIGLNEKGRLTFLNEIFDERGAKAFNSLLSDYQTYNKTLKEIKENSDGFSKSVSDALGTTTQGKVKALVAEFQLATSSIFNSNASSIKNFIDTVRQYVGSDEFRSALKWVTDAFIGLTKYVAENGKTILATFAAWMTVRGLLAAVEVFTALKTAILSLNLALGATKVAALSAMGALTGGLGLITALGIEYVLLGKKTDEASEASKAFQDRIDSEGRTLSEHLVKLEKNVELLELRNQLVRSGMSVEDAKASADARMGLGGKDDSTRGELMRKVAENAAKYEEAQKTIDAFESIRASGKAQTNMAEVVKYGQAMRERVELTKEHNALLEKQWQLSAQGEVMERGRGLKLRENQAIAKASLNDQVEAYNLRVKDLKESPRTRGLSVPMIGSEEAGGMSNEQLRKLIRDRNEELNRKLPGFAAPDTASAKSAAEALASSQLSKLFAESRRTEEQLKLEIKLRRELDRAKYNPTAFGPYMSELLAEQEARGALLDSIRVEQTIKEGLTAAQARYKPTDAKYVDIQKEIEARESNLASLRRELEAKREVEKWNAKWRNEKYETDAQGARVSLAAEASAIIERIRQQSSNKSIPGGDAAEESARTEVEKAYRSDILAIQKSLSSAKERERDLAKEVLANEKANLEEALQRWGVAEARVNQEQKTLDILTLQRNLDAQRAGSEARKAFDRSQTAEYGWEKFWKDYTENARSAAQEVQDIMKTTTNSMTDMFTRFAETGKLDFKGFVRVILAEASRILMSRAVLQLIGLAASIFGPSPSPGVGVVNGSAGTGFGGSIVGGGTRVTGAVSREGRAGVTPYVPTTREPTPYTPSTDYRSSVPFTAPNPAAQVPGEVKVNMQVTVNTDGNSKVTSDNSGQKAAELGKMLDQAVVSVIVRERRPGGLLSV